MPTYGYLSSGLPVFGIPTAHAESHVPMCNERQDRVAVCDFQLCERYCTATTRQERAESDARRNINMALYYAIDRGHLFRSELEIRLVTLAIVPGSWANPEVGSQLARTGFVRTESVDGRESDFSSTDTNVEDAWSRAP